MGSVSSMLKENTRLGLRECGGAICEPNYLIEEGYLDLHLWVTYKCPNKCPSCYLQALNDKPPDMKLEDVGLLVRSIGNYRNSWSMFRVTMYGAEPQSLPPSYYHKVMDIFDERFDNVEYGMYTSLQFVDDAWVALFRRIDNKNTLAMLAVSYDGGMRGNEYNKKLEASVQKLLSYGMHVGVMSVVNKYMLAEGASAYVDFLERNSIHRFSLKPFIPIEGQLHKWLEYAATMAEFSEYAIAVHEEIERRGFPIMSSTLGHVCNNNYASQNTGGYAIFVDGGMRALYMGYRNKMEYLQCWGKIDGIDGFRKVVENVDRKRFLADQRMLHRRLDCLVCEHSGRCLAEVFKDDYDSSGECIGAKKFVDWAYKKYGALYESGC